MATSRNKITSKAQLTGKCLIMSTFWWVILTHKVGQTDLVVGV